MNPDDLHNLVPEYDSNDDIDIEVKTEGSCKGYSTEIDIATSLCSDRCLFILLHNERIESLSIKT